MGSCTGSGTARSLPPHARFAVKKTLTPWSLALHVLRCIPSLQAFLAITGKLPDTLHRYEPCTVTASVIDLFVDGACRDPTDPAIRVASWAVHLVQVGDRVNPLVGGVLPGLVQTAVRAEITAMVSAVYFALASDADARVWCDNQHVVNRTREMWQQETSVHPNKPDHDLREKLQHGLVILKQRQRTLQVIKVAAPEADLGPVETWPRVRNTTVDAQAGWINNSRSDVFNQMHRQLIAQLGLLRPLVRRVQQVHIAVAHAALKEQVRRGSRAELEAPPVSITHIAPHMEVPHTLHTSLDKFFRNTATRLPRPYWIGGQPRTMRPSQCNGVVCSSFCFQKSTGHQGPVQLAKGGWAMAGVWLAPNTQRITWFLQVLKEVWGAQGILLRSAYVRPDSGAVRVGTRCLPWRWTRWRHQTVETWLREHLPAGVVQRGGVGIQALPTAKVDEEFIAQHADRQHGLHRWFQAA